MANENLRISKPFKGDYRISFKFGACPGWYLDRFGYPHNGVEFAMPVGTIIRACDDGIVIYADRVADSDGMGIIIKHDWGQSLYWHLSKLSVKWGTHVSKGQVIGRSGATGFVTGPHLHFGTRVSGQELAGMRGWSDPLNYIEEEEEFVPEVKPKYQDYIVMPGNTLWGIAEKFYGEGSKWPIIWNANKDKIKDPSKIYPLQTIRIPKKGGENK